MKYYITRSWIMTDDLEIEADTSEDAMEIAYTIPRTIGRYVLASMEIDDIDIKIKDIK